MKRVGYERVLFTRRVKKDMARWGGAPIIGERGLPLIGGTLVEEGHPLVVEGHTQMSFRRAKMPLLVGSYFIPPLLGLGCGSVDLILKHVMLIEES